MRPSDQPQLIDARAPVAYPAGRGPSVTIVVASRGSPSWLGAYFYSLVPQCLRDDAELIVVRADSPSAIAELSKAYPYVRFIAAPPRTSIAELRQAGLAAASGDVVGFLDESGDRTIPAEDWVDRLHWRRWTHPRLDVGKPGGGITSHAPRRVDDPPVHGRSRVTPSLSVVVPVHQGAGVLAHSLEAIARSDLPAACRELIVVDDASTDGTARIAAEFADVVIRLTGKPRGPAYARNRGFEFARGECVVFIDADVCVHRDALSRFARVLEDERDVSAVFGSYDANPPARGLVSQYRNLLLHHYHQQNGGESHTFWASCGAVRRAAFAEAGMFDEWRFPRHQIEDFELGYQLRCRGHRIVLRPEIQSTHLKRWTFRDLVGAEFQDRAVPWMRVFDSRVAIGHGVPARTQMRRRKHTNSALTLVGVALVVAAAIAGQLWLVPGAAGCVLLTVAIGREQHRFFARERGIPFAVSTVPLHLLSCVANGAAVVIGWVLREVMGEPTPHPSVEAYAEVGVRMWPPVPVKRVRLAPPATTDEE